MVEHLSSSQSRNGTATPSSTDSGASKVMTAGSSPVKGASTRAKVPTLDDIVARIKPSSISMSEQHAEEKENQREPASSSPASNDGRPFPRFAAGPARLQNHGSTVSERQLRDSSSSPAGSTSSVMSAPRGRAGLSDHGKTLAALREKAASRSRSTSPTKPVSYISTDGSSQSPLTPASSVATTHSQTSSSSLASHKSIPTLQDIRDHVSSKRTTAAPASTSPLKAAIIPTSTRSPSKEERGGPFASPFVRPPSPSKDSRDRTSPKIGSGVKTTVGADQSNSSSGTKGHAAAANVNHPALVKMQLHPLQHKWTLYFDSKSWNPSSTATSWEATLRMMGTYETVESFMSIFPTLRRPSQMERNCNYHLFKDGIKPMWEDKANANGGKWVLTLKGGNQALLDRSWMYLVLGLIGEELDEADDITGAVISTRAKGDRIAVWLREKQSVEKVNSIGKRFVQLLDVEREPGVSLEFVANDKGTSSSSKRARTLPMSPTTTVSVPSTPSTTWDEEESSVSKLPASTTFISFTNPMPHPSNPQPAIPSAASGNASRPQSNDSQSPRMLGSPSKPFGRRNLHDQSRQNSPFLGQHQGAATGGGMGLSLGGPIGRTGSPAPPSFRRQPLQG